MEAQTDRIRVRHARKQGVEPRRVAFEDEPVEQLPAQPWPRRSAATYTDTSAVESYAFRSDHRLSDAHPTTDADSSATQTAQGVVCARSHARWASSDRGSVSKVATVVATASLYIAAIAGASSIVAGRTRPPAVARLRPVIGSARPLGGTRT